MQEKKKAKKINNQKIPLVGLIERVFIGFVICLFCRFEHIFFSLNMGLA
jgi:hypothetical protein